VVTGSGDFSRRASNRCQDNLCASAKAKATVLLSVAAFPNKRDAYAMTGADRHVIFHASAEAKATERLFFH
jgi:hypothetical protein